MIGPVTWIAIGLGLMGLEALVPGFVIFWFGAGAMLVALLTALGVYADQAWQWASFFLSSLVFLGIWHAILRPRFGRKTVDETRDPTVSGQTGSVVREIRPGVPGEVELSVPLYGIRRWQAMADGILAEGTRVTVIQAEGVRLSVRPVRDDQPPG